MADLFLSISGLDRFLTITKPWSLCKPTRSLSRILPNKFHLNFFIVTYKIRRNNSCHRSEETTLKS